MKEDELTVAKILGDIKTKENDNTDLTDRMDDDYLIWKLEQSTHDTAINKKTKAHGSDINIIANTPRTFSDTIQAKLSAADMQIIVRMAQEEGEDKREDIGKLERLFRFALEKADERLRRLILPPLREQLIWFSMIRGWICGRFLVEKRSNKDVVFNFMPFDPRWFTHEVGEYDFLWTGYKTFRTAASLKSEYGKYSKTGKNVEVVDYWRNISPTQKLYAVICDGEFLRKETLNMKSMPILAMPVATRPPIAGNIKTSTSEGEVAGFGDSIFASIRGINGIRNRFLSIVASHANLMAKQALINYKTAQGVSIPSTSNVPDSVLELVMGENKLEASPMKEISPTTISILGELTAQVEAGTLPDLGIRNQPQSGTLESIIQEAGDRVFNAQLMNLNAFYSDICKLMEEQLLDNKIKVKVQQEADRKYYETQVTPIDLKKPHIIKVEFTTRTPWSQMDTAQIAQMLKALGLPDEWIWENILKVQDPKKLADLAAIELFEHSPKGAMKRAIEALIETRGDVQAALSLIKDLDRLEAQENMAMEGQAQSLEEPPPQGVAG